MQRQAKKLALSGEKNHLNYNLSRYFRDTAVVLFRHPVSNKSFCFLSCVNQTKGKKSGHSYTFVRPHVLSKPTHSMLHETIK